jgi:hypothetical protein
MSALAEAPTFTAELGEPDPGAGASAGQLASALLPRFVFSPFLTLPLDNERLKPRLIKPARITIIKEFVRHDRNFEFLKESEAISQNESMNNSEFVHTLVRPGDIERTLKNVFGYSGSVATGFIVIDELTGYEPDKREDDKRLILDLQRFLLPREPLDSLEQIELLETALSKVNGREERDTRELYRNVAQRLLDSTLTARAFCEQHIANTEAEMEMRASAGGSDQARGKMMLSAFDRMVCDWLRRPYPRISSKLTYEPQERETRGGGDTETRRQAESGRGDAATLDPDLLSQAIASSVPAIISGLEKAGVIETKSSKRKGDKDKKPRNGMDHGPLTTDH